MLHVFAMNLVALLASVMPVQATIGQGRGGKCVCVPTTHRNVNVAKGNQWGLAGKIMEQSFAKGQPVTSNLQINKIPRKSMKKASE